MSAGDAKSITEFEGITRTVSTCKDTDKFQNWLDNTWIMKVNLTKCKVMKMNTLKGDPDNNIILQETQKNVCMKGTR